MSVNRDELWRSVVGYEGLYSVSDRGRVFSDVRLDSRKHRRGGHFLSPSVNCRTGYLDVGLCKNGLMKRIKVHTLVLEAFVGPRPEGSEACHGPAGKQENSLTNLRWDTPKENGRDKVRHGTSARGERNGGGGKLTASMVSEIKRRLRARERGVDIARSFSVSKAIIYDIQKGRVWTHVS